MSSRPNRIDRTFICEVLCCGLAMSGLVAGLLVGRAVEYGPRASTHCQGLECVGPQFGFGLWRGYAEFGAFVLLTAMTIGSYVGGSRKLLSCAFWCSIALGGASAVAFAKGFSPANHMAAVTSNLIFGLLAVSLAVTGSEAAPSPSGNRLETRAIPLAVLTFACSLALCILSSRSGAAVGRRRILSEAVAQISSDELAPSDSLELEPSNGPDQYVLFTDMQCPTCHRLVDDVLQKWSVHRGRVVVRYAALPTHDDSARMSEVVELARLQGVGSKFLTLATEREGATIDDYYLLAKRLGVVVNDEDRQARARNVVARDLDLAGRLGIVATPTIVALREGQTPRLMSISKFQAMLTRQSGQ